MLISTVNARGIDEGRLPPRESDGRFRVLALTVRTTGLRTIGLEFEHFASTRDDLHVVSVLIAPSIIAKLAAHQYPFLPRRQAGAYRGLLVSKLWTQRILRRLDLRRFDAVHCTPQYYGMAVPQTFLERGVLSLHLDATTQNVLDEWDDDPIWNRDVVTAERELYPRADILASTSTWASDSLRDTYGVADSKIIWAPPTAVVPARAKDIARSTNGLVRMLWIGNNFDRKGGPEIVRWHQQRYADRAELHMVSTEARPAEVTGKNVIWHGRVPREELLSRLAPSCDFFVLPTKRDMTPWVIVEAQACGLPVITSRMAGIPDLLRDHETGYLVTPGDESGYLAAMDRLMDDPALRSRMSKAAEAYFTSNFTREIVFGRVVDAMKRVHAEKRRTLSLSAQR